MRPAPFDWKKWLGVVPFFLFTFLFILLPSLSLFVGSFQDSQGNFTFQNPASIRIHGFGTPEGGHVETENLSAWKASDDAGRPMSREEWPLSRVLRGEPLVPLSEVTFAESAGRVAHHIDRAAEAAVG